MINYISDKQPTRPGDCPVSDLVLCTLEYWKRLVIVEGLHYSSLVTLPTDLFMFQVYAEFSVDARNNFIVIFMKTNQL